VGAKISSGGELVYAGGTVTGAVFTGGSAAIAAGLV